MAESTNSVKRRGRGDRTLVLGVLFILGLLAVGLLHGDYGVTWDEGVQSEYGELALEYFASGGRDGRVLGYAVQGDYGPVYELLPAALYRWLGLPKYPTRHLVTGLLALLAFPGLFLLARRYRSPAVPLFSLLALLGLPRFVGHAFINSKDIPFAVAVVWFMWAASRLFGSRRLRGRDVTACSLALAAALWARPGAFPLLAVWLMVAGGAGMWVARSDPLSDRSGRLAPTSAAFLLVIVAAWALMVLPWPAAHQSPLAHPIRAMGTARAFPIEIPVLFDGIHYQSGSLPTRYAFEMLAVTTPPGLLLLAVIGVVGSLATLGSRRDASSRVTSALVLAWVTLPLGAILLLHPNLYDGIRHLLFLLPALALLAGRGAAWLTAQVPRGGGRAAAIVAMAVVLLAPLPTMIRLHPYQMTYFNALVGGTAGAQGRYETDYWVSSYAEAMRWINRETEGHRLVRVLVAGTSFVRPAAEHAAAPWVQVVLEDDPLGSTGDREPAIPDYYLATTRYGLHERFPGAPVVHTVGRSGAAFAVVKRFDTGEGSSAAPTGTRRLLRYGPSRTRIRESIAPPPRDVQTPTSPS